ncbi:MAG: hypothetical protein JWP37_133 [Mucilaginibacter sp.]|nr:hypothetical protein [Mucilaginibacter sp.]
MPYMHYLPLMLLIMAVMFVSVKTGKLTFAGAITGGAIAIMIFAGAAYTGIAMLGAFFIFGTAATVWKKKEKQQFKPIEDRSTKRNAGQVLANGGMPAVIGILIYLIPLKAGLLRMMMGASLASAMADTLSSELGTVYGKRFYNIITFNKDERGLDGVISVEGTLMGIGGSMVIAIVYALGFGWNSSFLFIIIAGTIGNISDSVLGVLLERKRYLNNDTVNFLNTFIAAIAVWLSVLLK